MIDLSVSIVNWNTKELLESCLESILSQTKGLNYNIWVVDNASSDGSIQMLEKEFPLVKLIKNSINAGFAKANNQILSRCDGKYVLLLNSDTQVVGNALKKLFDFMENHPEAGAAGCMILNKDGSLQTSCGRFPRLISIFFGGEICNNFYKKIFKNSTFFAEYGLSKEEHQYFHEVDIVKGCCLILKRSVLEITGLLDENFFMYCEETDLCYRIKKQGMKVLYTPKPVVMHLGGQSSNCRGQTVYRNLSSQEFYFRKHFGNLYALTMKWTVAIGSLIRIPLFLIAYLFARKGIRPFIKSKLIWNVYSLKWLLSGKKIQKGI